MTAKFAPEDILTPRNPAIPPQRRCFSSKSCFFFCVDGLIGANAPCLPRPDAFKQASFPCFTFVNQPRFAFQPASFHFPKQSKETLETLMIDLSHHRHIPSIPSSNLRVGPGAGHRRGGAAGGHETQQRPACAQDGGVGSGRPDRGVKRT